MTETITTEAATVMGETGIIFVCAECGTPVESEPCEEHQPAAYARCIGSADPSEGTR